MVSVIDGVPVELVDGEIRYENGASIDADGAPNAYALPGSGHEGLDHIRNAFRDQSDQLINPEHGYAGIIVDGNGAPVIQADGPFAGFCISSTALVDHRYATIDVRRYVDSTAIPYISIPPAIGQLGARLGDGALVACRATGRSVQCIVADVGPRKRIGEISVAAAVALGIPPSPRNGGVGGGVVVRIFLGSAADPPWRNERTAANIAALVDARAALT